jgi:bile acid:Na+ symporter, BASS family
MKSMLVEVFKVVLAVAIPLAAFTTGLGARPVGAGFLRRRPWLAVRSLLAILVLVPAWCLLFVRVLHPSGVVAAGLLVAILAVGIGPVGAMKRMEAPPEQARFAFELNVLVIAVSIVFIPLAVAVVGRTYGRHLELGPGAVAKLVLLKALLPMILGALVARIAPELALRSRRYLGLAVNVTLGLVLVFALLATWRDLLAMGAQGWLSAAAIALGAILIGHFMGGPEAETRGVLAGSSALRFPALALLLAQLTANPRAVMAEVLVYVITSLALMAIYAAVLKRLARPHGAGRVVEQGA